MDITGFKDRLGIIIKEEKSMNYFAKKCGISESLIRNYMLGKSLPGLDKLVVISNVADVEIKWLATGEGGMRAYKPDLAGSRGITLTYGEKFQKIRGNLSVAEFAALLRITENQVEALEKGEFNPDIHLISNICFRFNISPLWLLDDIGPMTKAEVSNMPQKNIDPQSMLMALLSARTAKKVLRTRGQTMTDDQWISVLIGSYETFVNHEALIKNTDSLKREEHHED